MEHVDRDDKGKVRSRVQMESGKLHGEARSYDEEERLVHLARYVEGKLEGESVTYDAPSGRKVEVANFAGGVTEGETIVFDESGRPAQRMTFKKGKLHGDL